MEDIFGSVTSLIGGVKQVYVKCFGINEDRGVIPNAGTGATGI
jgi:hypothetical protein